MTTFYATLDAEDGKIRQTAEIKAFVTLAEAREYLLAPHRAGGWNLATAEIGPGRWGDCWVKTHSAPREEDGELVVGLFDGSPFWASELRVAGPGEHPGGRAWWIEPIPAVLVITSIEAEVGEYLDVHGCISL